MVSQIEALSRATNCEQKSKTRKLEAASQTCADAAAPASQSVYITWNDDDELQSIETDWETTLVRFILFSH